MSDILQLCAECQALEGRDVEMMAHDFLISEEFEMRADGNLDRLRCLQCGSQWTRHEYPVAATAANKRSWKRMLAVDEGVTGSD